MKKKKTDIDKGTCGNSEEVISQETEKTELKTVINID